MKTIHTKVTSPKANKLIKALYKKILHKDDLFHFFYEPELVIRTKLHKQVCEILKEKKIKYEIYSYPIPVHKKGNYCYECVDFVLDNLDFFKFFYHQSSVFALTLDPSEYQDYISRIEHTACNTGGMTYKDEGARNFLNGVFRYQLMNSKYIDKLNYGK